MTTPLHVSLAGEGARASVIEPATTAGEPLYRIGAAAREVGVSPSVLRLWERQGLLAPLRTGSGYRLYTDADLDRLRRIRRMRDQQVSARGILRLLRPRPDAMPSGSPVGARLRQARHRQGLSLRETAYRARLSTSFLSALERDATGASVTSLQRITKALGLTMLDLFPSAPRHGRRVRPGERESLAIGSGVTIEQLARDAETLEPQLFVLAAGASSEGRYAHVGEEFIFVLDGDVTFWVGERERYRLLAGDSLTFPSTLPHRWRNGARGETRLLWINTPPTF